MDANKKPMTRWAIATTTFHTELVSFARAKGYDISRIWEFPDDAVGLGIKLNKLKSTLVEVGIKIERKKSRASSTWLIEVFASDNNNKMNGNQSENQQQQVSPVQ
jgi:post-segregation antitoxin (ccd killing protein)